MAKLDIQVVPIQDQSCGYPFSSPNNLQITFLNVTDAFPRVEAFANQSIKVLLKAQALEDGSQIRHSRAVMAS